MKSKTLPFILSLITLLILVACNTAGGIEPTVDLSVMTPEQAVITALVEYLEGQGAPVSQMNLELKTIAGDYARVEVVSTDPAVPGGFSAFMKRENGVWTTVVSGSGIEKEHIEALGIPPSVWPAGWLEQGDAPAVSGQPPITFSEDGCPVATVASQTQSLVDEARGFCLLYPASHTVEQLESGNTEIVLGSLMNHSDPRVSIVVEELAGRSLEQAVDEFLTGYEGFEIAQTPVIVGDEKAVQLDNVPGQDYYRKVLVAHNGFLYQLSFSPYDPGLVDTFAQAEHLYRIVIDSLHFVDRGQAQTAGSTPKPGPPICPQLPRPAMVFQADNGEDYLLRHAASKLECTIQFDPPISRLLLLTVDGVYYSTPVIGEAAANHRILHYANDGTRSEQSFLDADSIGSLVISSSGSHVAWSQRRIAETTEGEEIIVSELYSAKTDGSDIRLLHSMDNADAVNRGEPYIGWIIHPLRFLDESELLFTIEPDGRGGSWNAQTGRYSNLYQISISTAENDLIYECPADDFSSFCIGDISADSAYFAVTKREAGEITLFHMDGTPVGTYSGPGQDYIGFPTFGPTGDFVFMTADVAGDQITIEQAFMSLVTKPYETAAIILLREPLSYIWDWVDEQHIFYTAVEDGQTVSFLPSLVKLDGAVERLPETYGLFQGVLP